MHIDYFYNGSCIVVGTSFFNNYENILEMKKLFIKGKCNNQIITNMAVFYQIKLKIKQEHILFIIYMAFIIGHH